MAAELLDATAAETMIRRLWTEDGQTYAQIAQALTTATGQPVTRNAIAGRIRRLGLQGMQAPAETLAEPAEPTAGENAETGPSRPSAKSLSVQQKVDAVDESPAGGAEMGQSPNAGAWPIADLRGGQCRFACTPHTARPDQHRFCGEPVAWHGGKPTSWCREHLDIVAGLPGRTSGGASVADAKAGRARPDREPPRSGWGAIGA